MLSKLLQSSIALMLSNGMQKHWWEVLEGMAAGSIPPLLASLSIWDYIAAFWACVVPLPAAV